MRKSECVDFFEKYLHEVSRGRGYRECENPAVRFTNDAKAGKYDKLSDASYDILLQEAKDLSAFWLNQSRRKASDVLQIALENIDIDKDSLHKVAEVLSECYSASVKPFLSEDLIKESEIQEEDFDFVDEKYLDDPLPEKEEPAGMGLDSPPEIYEWLKKRIYGQENAVRAAAMLLYNHRRGRRRNLLFVGQTGCGKTEIWRVCSELYPSIRIIDPTRVRDAG